MLYKLESSTVTIQHFVCNFGKSTILKKLFLDRVNLLQSTAMF